MSRHKHPLCESICPKQIFLSNFPKEISFGQSYYTCVLVQLSPPSSFSTLTNASSICSLRVLQFYQFHRNWQLCKRRWGKRHRCKIFFSDILLIPLPKPALLYKHLESLYPNSPGTTGTQSRAQGSRQAAGQVQEQHARSCPCSPLPHQSPHHP